MIPTNNSVKLDYVFDLHSFDNSGLKPWSNHPKLNIGKEAHDHSVQIDQVTTVMFEIEGTCNRKRLDAWLQALLWEKNVLNVCYDGKPEIMRFKALMNVEGAMCVVQAVQEIFDIIPSNAPLVSNKLVFIGKNIDKILLRSSFQSVIS